MQSEKYYRQQRAKFAKEQRERPVHLKLFEKAKAFIRQTRYDKSVNPNDLVWTVDAYIAYKRGEGKVKGSVFVKDRGLTSYLLGMLECWAVDMNIYPVHLRFLPPYVPPRVRMYLFCILVGGDLEEPWPHWEGDNSMWEDPTAEDLYLTLWEKPYEEYYGKHMEAKRKEERRKRVVEQRDLDARMADRWYDNMRCVECNYVHRRSLKRWVTIYDHRNQSTDVSLSLYCLHLCVSVC